jgi:hypothetical protein
VCASQILIELATEGQNRVRTTMTELVKSGFYPAISGDIWSENGISIFGILGYYINDDFEMVEVLLGAIPFSDVRHTGLNIGIATKECLSDMGIGKYITKVDENGVVTVLEDTVADNSHRSVADAASNMTLGWDSLEGHLCQNHVFHRGVMPFYKHPGLSQVQCIFLFVVSKHILLVGVVFCVRMSLALSV